VMQDEKDRENMKHLITKVQGLQVMSERVCASYGVVTK